VTSNSICLIHILILFSHVHVCLPSGLFLRGLLAKFNMLLPTTPYVPYDFPSFPPLFSTPHSYLMKYINQEYSRFVLICSTSLISFVSQFYKSFGSYMLADPVNQQAKKTTNYSFPNNVTCSYHWITGRVDSCWKNI